MALQRIISPIDGSVLAERETASAAEIEGILERSVRARADWRRVPVEERIEIVERMVGAMLARADDIGVELARQMGRPVRFAPMEITRGFQERARHMSAIAPDVLADTGVEPKEGFARFIRREPVGTVLVVAPWNYPYLTSVNSVVPALLAGNSVVLKHATQTLLCAERYSEAFAEAGLPDGLFQHVHATHDDVAQMIGDPRVGFVAFTGSVGAGHAIQRAAAGRFIATGLELGGKDPAYVRADADLRRAVAETVDGSFFNSGQSCCAVERIYVHRDRYEEFVERFVVEARGYVLGDPLDAATTIGPMVSASAAADVRGQIEDALARGAQRLVGDPDFPAALIGSPYVAPTVLVDVDHTMRVMTEESFGPVIGIMPVDGDDEAIAYMNDSDYGLTASIWTEDLASAIELGDRVETGTCYMNRCDYLDPALAWTGVKDTGHGCTLSTFGFDAFTRPKSFHLKLSA